MQLCEKIFVVERHTGDSFPQVRDRFRDDSHTLFISGRKKKRPQEGAVNAVTKRKLCFSHALEHIFRERRHTQKGAFQYGMPGFRAPCRQHATAWGAVHSFPIPPHPPPPSSPLPL